MSEVKRYFVYWNDQIYSENKDGDIVMAADFDRVTAERDAGLAREAALAQNLKYAEQGYISIAESADASTQTLHEVISRLKAERDALQALLTAADERADEDDMVLRSSVPERHKGCTSPVGAVQSYIVELEGRADVLEGLLRDASNWIKHNSFHGVDAIELWERIDAALKPAEGGGDEA